MLTNSNVVDISNNNNTTNNSSSSNGTNNIANNNSIVSNSSVPCWSITLEPALNHLFPSPENLESAIVSSNCPLSSDDYLKLYTAVFEFCVGTAVESGKKAGHHAAAVGLNISGEELYFTLIKYLQVKLSQWSKHLETLNSNDDILDKLLCQLDKLQAAEKPLTFIFTYLERHWIDRQINEPRVDILPMKQLIWSMWDSIVFEKYFKSAVLPKIGIILQNVRNGQIELESLDFLARFVHYLRVISKPTQLESDFKATRRTMMAGAVLNLKAEHKDRFKEFVQFFCEGIREDCPKISENKEEEDNLSDFIQNSLKFWNEEEGRMAFLRFEKASQVTVSNHLKSILLLPNLQKIKAAFNESICNWNTLESNAIYRLLANRKSLLVHLDSESESAFIKTGQDLLMPPNAENENHGEDLELVFINSIGQYYSKLDELIQTSFASRPEIYESRSRALRVILNNPSIITRNPRNSRKAKGFSARSLAKFADFIIRNYPESTDENLKVLVALFRLIDEKEEFLETYNKLLTLRLLTGSTRIPCSFETNLLHELKEICGNYAIKCFARMFGDIQNGAFNDMKRISDTSAYCGTVVLTAGNWNIKGKLFPGHVLFSETPEGRNSLSVWPSKQITSEILEMSSNYHQKHPKRKLFWSPFMSTVEFSYSIGSNHHDQIITIKASCLHLTALQMVGEGSDFGDMMIPFGDLIMDSLVESGLVLRLPNYFALNYKYDGPNEIDLFNSVMTELLVSTSSSSSSSSSSKNHNSQSTATGKTTPHYFTGNSNRNSAIGSNTFTTSTPMSQMDKSILLQCSITKILKQVRLQSLPDLYNRISMLPKLLTRFSPSIKEVLEALKQLHEKEFVKLAVGESVDDFVDCDCEGDDLSNLDRLNTNKLFIRYLA